MQEGHRVTFTAPLQAVLEPFGRDEELGNGQVLLKLCIPSLVPVQRGRTIPVWRQNIPL